MGILLGSANGHARRPRHQRLSSSMSRLSTCVYRKLRFEHIDRQEPSECACGEACGTKPADIPVEQRVDLVINLLVANGLEIPTALLARACGNAALRSLSEPSGH